jgi:hypothetical protein
MPDRVFVIAAILAAGFACGSCGNPPQGESEALGLEIKWPTGNAGQALTGEGDYVFFSTIQSNAFLKSFDGGPQNTCGGNGPEEFHLEIQGKRHGGEMQRVFKGEVKMSGQAETLHMDLSVETYVPLVVTWKPALRCFLVQADAESVCQSPLKLPPGTYHWRVVRTESTAGK